ncbi:YfcE family phosphodiesterase [Sporanaerobium hydrogeniformans]|uniref:YfcE family phosphodiesterase n=1 Tax=Sporanaerobium hydrogeniformans TaxID=3072179 RepID=A0AC61DAL4_9FIRM|nr:metallophosphoesterase family protein [Sporanaerobium hydrogeniformans]PHV69905.1 YfcE family phosphodiesterase [Sporanaerobium hydrogeniformans]
MKIGVISDTHGLLREEVLENLKGCDAIIHGGDINKLQILESLEKIAPLYAVRGNNDKGEWAEALEKEKVFNLGNKRFLLIHNKREITHALEDVDICIYGHSHQYKCEKKGNTWWLNPGSCGKRRFSLPITLALIEIEEEGLTINQICI